MIEAANHLPYNPQETNYTKITQEEIQREVDYWCERQLETDPVDQ